MVDIGGLEPVDAVGVVAPEPACVDLPVLVTKATFSLSAGTLPPNIQTSVTTVITVPAGWIVATFANVSVQYLLSKARIVVIAP